MNKIFKLQDIIHQHRPMADLAHSGKIPWNDPAFSERMLKNHLSQENDWASRRLFIIDKQVAWIRGQLPAGGRVLDLGCGPGLYLQRLAHSGFECTGVDFSPASIDYARQQSLAAQLNITYHCEDVRTFSPATQQDFVMMTFGEFNVFSREDAQSLLHNAVSWLKPGGQLLLEVHTLEEVKRQGLAERCWESHQTGIFSVHPHLVLTENNWDEQKKIATTAWWIIEESGETSLFTSHTQGWSDEEYYQHLQAQGLDAIRCLTVNEWPCGEIFAEKLYTLHGIKD